MTCLCSSHRHPSACWIIQRRGNTQYGGNSMALHIYTFGSIVPSQLHHTAPSTEQNTAPASRRICLVTLQINDFLRTTQTSTKTIEHTLNLSFCITSRVIHGSSRLHSSLTSKNKTPQYHHQQQIFHHALPGLGCHPLPQGLPGAVQGVQDDMLRRAGWQWQWVRG